MKILLSGFCALSLWAASGLPLFAQNASAPAVASAGFPIDLSDTTASAEVDETWNAGSPYVPVDWWVYPALERLYALGYISDEALKTALFTHTAYTGESLMEAETLKDKLLLSINRAIAETQL